MTSSIAREAVQKPESANRNTKRVVTQQNTKTWGLGESPYTAKNIDGAITHLEMAVAVDDNIAVFGRRYWFGRVEHIASTPQIMPAQARRLQCLLDQLKGG